MAPKKKQAAQAKSNEAAIINGSQALQLKAALDAGQSLDDETLLKLLHADVPCEGLYSKTCKVRSVIFKTIKSDQEPKLATLHSYVFKFLLLYSYCTYFSQLVSLSTKAFHPIVSSNKLVILPLTLPPTQPNF